MQPIAHAFQFRTVDLFEISFVHEDLKVIRPSFPTESIKVHK